MGAEPINFSEFATLTRPIPAEREALCSQVYAVSRETLAGLTSRPLLFRPF